MNTNARGNAFLSFFCWAIFGCSNPRDIERTYEGGGRDEVSRKAEAEWENRFKLRVGVSERAVEGKLNPSLSWTVTRETLRWRQSKKQTDKKKTRKGILLLPDRWHFTHATPLLIARGPHTHANTIAFKYRKCPQVSDEGFVEHFHLFCHKVFSDVFCLGIYVLWVLAQKKNIIMLFLTGGRCFDMKPVCLESNLYVNQCLY